MQLLIWHDKDNRSAEPDLSLACPRPLCPFAVRPAWPVHICCCIFPSWWCLPHMSLVAYGCSNKMPQTRWFKTVYDCIFLEAQSQSQGVMGLCFVWNFCASALPASSSFWWLSAILCVPWLVAAALQPLSPSSHVWVSISFPYKDTSHWT